MERISYKTNISNASAVIKLAPVLNSIVGPSNWQLDLNSKEKKLTVFTKSIISEIQVEEAIKNAGFSALNLEDYYAIY